MGGATVSQLCLSAESILLRTEGDQRPMGGPTVSQLSVCSGHTGENRRRPEAYWRCDSEPAVSVCRGHTSEN